MSGHRTGQSRCIPECWAQPECSVCHLRKNPRGRSAPLEMANSLCDHECTGYELQPQPGHHWPNEECDDNCK